MKNTNIILLGSTGSVGEQAADVAMRTGTRVCALAANKNAKRVEEQARFFHPHACAMADTDAARDLRVRLADTNIRVYDGTSGVTEMIADVGIDSATENNRCIVLNAIVGEIGLESTLQALSCGLDLALANKESLVVAGEIVMRCAREHGAQILPVDSEHCAIFQCLQAGKPKELKRILLTASGGPFYGYTKEELACVTPERTLAHPTWKMGKKITVDSATLMNKGFELIEAVHLFGVKPDAVKVIIQRESIIHSMVEYIDNSIIAQLAVPDMRHCVQYALTYPNREEGVCEQMDFDKLQQLTFGVPDYNAFPLLRLASDAIYAGGTMPAVLNAANEIAVDAFLNNRLRFVDISLLVAQTVDRLADWHQEATLEGILAADRLARKTADALLSAYTV